MDMSCFISIVTTMITSLMSTVIPASSATDFHPSEMPSVDYSFGKEDRVQQHSHHADIFKSTMASTVTPHHSYTPDVTCCDGVLGYASDNVSLNYPCQLRPCCNKSHTQAVVPIEFALGFRFQCMPRSFIQTMCYASGTEVRTSNHDPDFIPRACCPGLRFNVELHHWYAALVIRCVSIEDGDS